MNTQKTGILIAEARREKGLTQKQLALQLHVSDRTISKWERGVGFPDVTLLEPLAQTLEVSIIDLIQGERGNDTPSEITIRSAIQTIGQQLKANMRKQLSCLIACIALLLFLLGLGYMVLEVTGAFSKEIAFEKAVGVYVDGVKIAESNASVSGKRRTFRQNSFYGHFAIDYIDKTCRKDVTAIIKWNSPSPGHTQMLYDVHGTTWLEGNQSVITHIYISDDMNTFALKLADGTVIATDEYLVPLIMLEQHYPLDF